MADFQKAVELTLAHEGGYVDNKNDSGGATNMGIEQRDLPLIPIKDLTVADAKNYYRQYFWPGYPVGYYNIQSQAVANKLFDIGVLFGLHEAIKLVQRALGLATDGKFGQETLDGINGCLEVELLPLMKKTFAAHAEAVVAANPKDQEFLKGWLNRINS